MIDGTWAAQNASGSRDPLYTVLCDGLEVRRTIGTGRRTRSPSYSFVVVRSGNQPPATRLGIVNE